MFVSSLHLTGRLSRKSALAVLFLALGMLALSPRASANAASQHVGITPAAILAESHPARHSQNAKHFTGALLPRKQVDARVSTRSVLATLPASVDLSSYDVPVGYQGAPGSCTTWAIDYAMLGWYSKHDGRAGQPFNPMYTYSQIHLSSTAADGGGSNAQDALAYATNQGNDTLAHYSHNVFDFLDQPNASERANAANWKIAGWQTLFQNVNGLGSGSNGSLLIQTALASGKPVAIGLQVRPGFDTMDHTNPLDDDITGASRGGHEVLAIAYDQSGLWIQNSWDTTWGLNGYGRLSWRVVANDVFQAHTISGFAAVATADTTKPVMSSITERFQLSHQASSTTAPVSFTWSASDASGIAAFAVYTKTDSGQFVQDTTVPATATQVAYSLSAGHTYQIAVAAKDGAGNWSAFAYSVVVSPSITDDAALAFGSPWARYSLTGTIGGTYIASSAAGSSYTATFTGRHIALIAPQFSTAGRATVYCDGASIGLVDLYSSATVTRQVLAECHFTVSGQHTMKLVAEGTSGRPWIGVDAFATM